MLKYSSGQSLLSSVTQCNETEREWANLFDCHTEEHSHFSTSFATHTIRY